MTKLNIDRDEIKEKLNVLRVYLIITLATGITVIAWLTQNINAPKESVLIVGIFISSTLIFSVLVEKKIHKLINLFKQI